MRTALLAFVLYGPAMSAFFLARESGAFNDIASNLQLYCRVACQPINVGSGWRGRIDRGVSCLGGLLGRCKRGGWAILFKHWRLCRRKVSFSSLSSNGGVPISKYGLVLCCFIPAWDLSL